MTRSGGFAASLMSIASISIPWIGVAGPASAQETLLDILGPKFGDSSNFGIAAGDWNGDGTGDLAIGAIGDDAAGLDAGAARIHSGRDGSVLAEFLGEDGMDRFGTALALLPDVDGDVQQELLVSAGYAGSDHSGAIYVYAGRTGNLLLRLDEPGGRFGAPMGSAGDVDGDGDGDLFATRFASDYLDGGVVHVYSGADGHEIRSFASSPEERFGTSVSLIDDLDGDGLRDLLIGAPGHPNRSVGAVYVVSMANGTILRTTLGTIDLEQLGTSSAALADLDGDAVGDYAVAVDHGPTFTGAEVLVYSGATGAELGRIGSPAPMEQMRPEVVAAGDLNGDGYEDLAVLGWLDAFLVSGKTLLHLDRIEVDVGDLGNRLAAFGDLDGDGFDDLVFGTEEGFNGRVRVFGGNDLWVNATPGAPKPGDVLALETREGSPGALTILALEEIDGVPLFQMIGGLATFDQQGGRLLRRRVPPGLSGHELQFRAYANDAAGRAISSARQAISFQ